MKTTLLLKSLLLLVFCFASFAGSASHLRGGYITYTADPQNARHLYFQMVLFHNAESPVVDLDARIDLGDGQTVNADRASYTAICNLTVRSVYNWEHTYLADGTYPVIWNGLNRNNGVLNFSPPSDMYSMAIHTAVTINAFRTHNGITVAQPARATAHIGQPFKLNLLATETDGDLLTYSLVAPQMLNASNQLVPVPGYTQPTDMSIDQNGLITWENPVRQGEYNFTVHIEKLRNQVRLSDHRVDVQILVVDQTNVPNVTLVNRDRLNFTDEGYILVNPNTPLKLIYFTPKPAAGTQSIATSGELFQPNFENRYTLQEAVRDSANGVVRELIFTFPPEMERVRPYAVNAEGVTTITHPLDNTSCNTSAGLYDQILVDTRTITSAPGAAQDVLKFKVYPNPARHNFTVDAPPIAGTVLAIYATDGRLMHRVQLKPGRNLIARPATLTAGLYLYSISSPNDDSAAVTRGKLMLQ